MTTPAHDAAAKLGLELANRAIRHMGDVSKSPMQLAEELARLRRDNAMLNRQLDALHDTDIGALATRNDELVAELGDLKAKLAGLGVIA